MSVTNQAEYEVAKVRRIRLAMARTRIYRELADAGYSVEDARKMCEQLSNDILQLEGVIINYEAGGIS